MAETDAERANPWLLLKKSLPDGAIPVIGDEASVYANHAQNVANYIGCESAPVTLPPATAPAG